MFFPHSSRYFKIILNHWENYCNIGGYWYATVILNTEDYKQVTVLLEYPE
jgi:hypothetical protein